MATDERSIAAAITGRIDARPKQAKTAADYHAGQPSLLDQHYARQPGAARSPLPAQTRPRSLTRLSDTTAQGTGLDPVERKRRNLILGGLSAGQADIALQQSGMTAPATATAATPATSNDAAFSGGSTTFLGMPPSGSGPSTPATTAATPIPGAPRASAATFDGKPADQFFREAAQRQKQSNAYAEYKPEPATQVASSSPPIPAQTRPRSSARATQPVASTSATRPKRTPLPNMPKLPTLAEVTKEATPQPPLARAGLTSRQNWARNLQQKSQELTERSQRQRAAVAALPGLGNLRVAEAASPAQPLQMETPLQTAGRAILSSAKQTIDAQGQLSKAVTAPTRAVGRIYRNISDFLNTPRPTTT